MDGDWPLVAIGDIAEVVGGSTPSTKDPENFNGDIPWLTPKDLSGPHDRYVTRGERNLSPKGLASCSARLLPRGTVLLTTRAPIGYVAIAGREIATNQGFRSLILREGVCPEFVYYWLKVNKAELERHASGSTFRELSGSSLKRIRIPLPKEPEQRAIAHILGTLDDKIELLRKMNETLEAIARALFKAWFVDFAPVRAKMEGRWKRGQSLLGLPAHIYDLFPDRLVDSELGEIPEGWQVPPIGDCVRVLGGGTPSTKQPQYWVGGEHPFCTPKDMASLVSPVLLQTERHLTDEGIQKVSSGQLPAGTVLLSSRAPVGYLAIAEVPVSVNQGIIAMVCDRLLPNLYVLLWARANMEVIEANANGSTFQEISKKNFRPIPVVVPSAPVLDGFTTIVRPIHKRIVANARESRTLAALRDALLPKLISGELRLADPERILTGASP